jgi:hypothetical protein
MGRDRTQQATWSVLDGIVPRAILTGNKAVGFRSNGMFCPKTCPTPSSNSMIENWTCSLRRVSKGRSGEEDATEQSDRGAGVLNRQILP